MDTQARPSHLSNLQSRALALVAAASLAACAAPLPAPRALPAARSTVPPAPAQVAAADQTKALRARVGLYDISAGDEGDVGVGAHLTADFTGASNWGGGADLFLATTFGDAGDLDARAVAARLWGYALYAHPTAPIQFRFGPEFIAAYAGDEVGGEYQGIGLKGSVYGETPVGETLTGFGELGLGFNSGDGELYTPEVDFDEDLTVLDIVLGLRSERGIAGGLDLQFLGADEGEDIEVIGVFAQFDF
ncbi:MAG: hypothetical protein AAGB93_17780 [Planctomycetota bacterium]